LGAGKMFLPLKEVKSVFAFLAILFLNTVPKISIRMLRGIKTKTVKELCKLTLYPRKKECQKGISKEG